MSEDFKIVSDKLSDKAYELLKLPNIEFKYGSLLFFNKDNIDEMQAGFRYNGRTGEKIQDWTGDAYVIVGYDETAGCGPDPVIVKTDDEKLPVYWLMTDGGDWDNPTFVCDSLEEFSKSINMLNEYANFFRTSILTEELKQEIIDKIGVIENKEIISEYWDYLLSNALPSEVDQEEIYEAVSRGLRQSGYDLSPDDVKRKIENGEMVTDDDLEEK